ncbi:acyltransferase family protein [Mucilaginibacter sp. FT3.2]|uniref:acyltransferase family protein n=1 Tax=Mucilaginibacter sp. FT3.2 TaxID=2723090 RepID=UPI00160DFDA0|nr:acyltransferase [Mucilaginibacter sp. FT3.2]MBB6231305.1 peptidoglycan/LPS O-acetylase OafA/YrhL [Mucilaginibacter sp. FT3.2]
MAEKQIRPVYDNKLEGLRGLCALVVAISHFLTFNFFQSSKIPFYGFFIHLEFAHEAVLIFFLLSGYVIGINHIQTPFNWANVILYLKKRFIRLYPIYFIALLISFGFYIDKGFSAKDIIGHLFFMQEFLVKTISSNSPLWSLSYEVIYYLLFLGLWKTGKYNMVTCLSVGLLILTYLLIAHDLTNLKSLLIGSIFWMAGLYIAQTKITFVATSKRKWQSFISYFAIILSIHNFDTKELIPQILHLNVNHTSMIEIGDLLYLPICFIIIMEISSRTIKYINAIKVLAYTVPAFHLFLLIYYKHPILSNIDLVYGTGYFIFALVVLPIHITFDLFGRLNNLGRVSYALYVFHFPALYFLNSWLSKHLSGPMLLIVGLSASIIVTGLLSVTAELVIQPRIKKYLISKS